MAYYPQEQQSYVTSEEVQGHVRKSIRGVPHPVRRYNRRRRWGLAVRVNPEVLYHLTPEENVEQILREGLKPSDEGKMESNFPTMPERTHGRVFMVPRQSDLKRVMAYMPHGRMAILRVNTEGLPLYEGENRNVVSQEERARSIDPEHVEYFATRRIRPERISVVGTQAGWD